MVQMTTAWFDAHTENDDPILQFPWAWQIVLVSFGSLFWFYTPLALLFCLRLTLSRVVSLPYDKPFWVSVSDRWTPDDKQANTS